MNIQMVLMFKAQLVILKDRGSLAASVLVSVFVMCQRSCDVSALSLNARLDQ